MINRVTNENRAAHLGRPDPEVQAGRALRRLRLAKGWSQEEVAKRMKTFGYEFHQTMIAKIEAAQRPLRVHELADFAALYGVEIQDLIYAPAGSVSEVENEISEISRRRDLAGEVLATACDIREKLRCEWMEAEKAADMAGRDFAILDSRLHALLREKDRLINW